MNKHIAALLEERQACVARKRTSRVQDIDAELQRLGYRDQAKVETTAVEPDVEVAAVKKAAKRKV